MDASKNKNSWLSFEVDSSSDETLVSAEEQRKKKFSGLKKKNLSSQKKICSIQMLVVTLIVAIFAVACGQLVVTCLVGARFSNTATTIDSIISLLFAKEIITLSLSDFINVHRGGMFNVYTSPSHKEILFQVYESSMGDKNLFIRSNLVAKSDGNSGDLGLGMVPDWSFPVFYFKWDGTSKRIKLYEKKYDLRSTDPQMVDIMKKGAADGWVAEFALVERGEENAEAFYVFDARDFVTKELLGVESGNKVFKDLPLSTLVKVENYEKNINFFIERSAKITSEVDFRGKSEIVGVLISLARLPENPIIGRASDSRVGFFGTSYSEVGYHPGKRFSALIQRWRLEKSKKCDVNNVCEPVKSIVFYIDPSVPKRWRKCMVMGVNAWQKAFESIGFKNTPRAVLPNSSDWPKDYNAGDIRYASISWGIQKATFAIGPTVSDPRSGEILDSDIMFAMNWVDSLRADDGSISLPHFPIKMDRFHHDHHDHHDHSSHKCDLQKFMMEEIRFLQFTNGEFQEKHICDALASISAHEVGHGLGLRHNFKGSTTMPLNQLNNKSYIDQHGLGGSVMDYFGLNHNFDIAEDTADQKDIYYPVFVGGYDKIAVEYGYTVLPNETQGIQQEALKAIASKVKSQGYAFAPDEEVYTFTDPLAMPHDMSDDPIEYSIGRSRYYRQLRNVTKKKCTGYFPNTMPIYNACIEKFEMAYLTKLFSEVEGVLPFVGGRVLSRDFPSENNVTDPEPPIKIVSPIYFEKAIGLFKDYVHDTYYYPTFAAGQKSSILYTIKYDGDYNIAYSNINDMHVESSKYLMTDIIYKLKNVDESAMLARMGQKSWVPAQTADMTKNEKKELTVYKVLMEVFKIVWRGPNGKLMSQYQTKIGILQHFVELVTRYAEESQFSTASTQAQARQVMFEVRGNATAMLFGASGWEKRFYEKLICNTLLVSKPSDCQEYIDKL